MYRGHRVKDINGSIFLYSTPHALCRPSGEVCTWNSTSKDCPWQKIGRVWIRALIAP
jgi:hypothetical protein